MKKELLVYTRKPIRESYPKGLAESIHFAVSTDRKTFKPLFRNYGILFACADISCENTILAKGLKNPIVFQMQGNCYGIMADCFYEDAENTEETRVYWETRDFVHFKYKGRCFLTNKESVIYRDYGNLKYPEGAICGNTISISEELFRTIDAYWNQTGKAESFAFPLARGYADPVIFQYKGKYYFTATNDNAKDIGLYVREADSMEGLFYPDIKEEQILDVDEEKRFCQTFWAPEFHEIGGSIYILFAVSPKNWGPQCHMMKLKDNASISKAASWEKPIPVHKRDGVLLSTDGITLDMTYFKCKEKSYVVWSYRKGIGTTFDTGSMLYIATIDESEPWKLTSEPTLLSRPLYGWENVNGTNNNEAPAALILKNKIYLTYSAGAADSYTYAVGVLTADIDANLLDNAEWEKNNTPILSFYSNEGEYGPGHNSFFVTRDSVIWMVYHAEESMSSKERCTALRRVFIGKDNQPIFDMETVKNE